jgi:hypothetical protein
MILHSRISAADLASCGPSYPLSVGSPQSRKGDERKEAKLDAILETLTQKKGTTLRRNRP